VWWYTPLIPATVGSINKRIMVQDNDRDPVSKTAIAKRAGNIA
jgi:hypothetical protein